jgi:hypothetical protein
VVSKKQPGTVTLVAPSGVEVTASSPAEVINLVYGHSYRPKHGSAEEAVAAVAESVEQGGDAA